MKTIIKTGTAKFKVITDEVKGSELELDFNPVIKKFHLWKRPWLEKPGLPSTSSIFNKKRDYQLIHWQGRPKGDREWGIYDAASDSYRCGVWEDTKFAYGAIKMLMLDDKTAVTLPSAVIYFTGSSLPSGDSV